MHKLYDLKEKLMQELEDYSENGKYSKEDVESIKYIASAIDHICNIVDGEEEYSMAMDGRMMYDGGSYARRPYARGGRTGGNMQGSSYRRGGRRGANQYGSYAGGYSRAGEDIAEQLRGMMEDAPDEKIRMEIERLAEKVERM